MINFTALYHVFAFIFGAVVGSFLNVVIHRVPLEESIAFPASRCPKCETPIRWYQNIPVLSWLALRGRCASCRSPIAVRYPIVEALTGLLALAVFSRYGMSWLTPYYFVFVAALVAITFIDLDHMIIPDAISLPGALVGLAGKLVFDLVTSPAFTSFDVVLQWALDSATAASLLAIVAGAGGFWLLAIVHEKIRGVEGLGGGDIKLMAMVGAFTSPFGVLQTILVGSLIGTVVGVAYLAVSGKGGQTRIPFGPFLAFGAMTAALVPELMSVILGWQLGLFAH